MFDAAAHAHIVVAPTRHSITNSTTSSSSSAVVSIKPNLKLMSNSERGKYYRRKRKVYAVELDAHVTALRRQIDALVVRQQLQNERRIDRRRTPDGSFAKLVREYFCLFEYGTPVVAQAAGSTAVISTSTDSHVARASPQQLSFLRAAMEPHVGFGEFAGIALLVDQWQRYSQFHGGIWFELTALDVVRAASTSNDDANTFDDDESATPVIKAHANLHVRITRDTVEQVFPHLVAQDADDAIVQALVGLEVAYPCVNHFYFTPAGTIARYDPHVDFLSALLAKIDSLEGVAHVLARARIAKHHMIGMRDDDGDDAITMTAATKKRPSTVLMTDDAASSNGFSSDDDFGATSPAQDSVNNTRQHVTSRHNLEYILS